MTIDITKKYKSRDGRPVRILATDAPSRSGHPVIGLVGEITRRWNLDGRSASGNAGLDLEEVVPTVWRTIGESVNAVTDIIEHEGRGYLFVGGYVAESLEELRRFMTYYKFAGEFKDGKLLRVVAL